MRNRLFMFALMFVFSLSVAMPLTAADKILLSDGSTKSNVFVIELGIKEVKLGRKLGRTMTSVKSEDFQEVENWAKVPITFNDGWDAYKSQNYTLAIRRMASMVDAPAVMKRKPCVQVANFVLGESYAAAGNLIRR